MATDNVRWVQSQLGGIELTEDLARCVETMSAVRPPHNWWPVDGWRNAAADLGPEGALKNFVELDGKRCARHSVYFDRFGMTLFMRRELATYDGDDMTRLVIAAHEHRVRVAVDGGYVMQLPDWDYGHRWPVPTVATCLLFTPRDAIGDRYKAHPGPEELAASAGGVGS
jgi:hypothetical protein